MSNAIGIALSGTLAETRRVEASASNIANMRTRGTLPGAQVPGADRPYEPLTTVQTDERMADGKGAGTRAVFHPINRPFVPEHDPGDPAANAEGFVGAPNVDLGREFTQQILAKHAYKAGLSVMKADDEMTRSLLKVTA